jgi:hypothetical protein
VVSVFAVSVLMVSLAVVSLAGVDMVADESVDVLSLPVAAFSELQPVATAATIAVAKAIFKNCFFIGSWLLLYCCNIYHIDIVYYTLINLMTVIS